MVLYFLRHGDAVESALLHDSERPLSELGQQQATGAGRFLALLNAPLDLILCSPLLRARQTGEAVQRELGVKAMTTSEYLASSANPLQLFTELNNAQKEQILLVGHEPHLSTSISLLIAGDERAHLEMKKSSVACVSISKPIVRGAGVLKWIVTSEQMKIALQERAIERS
jgi:phosphohistidine phosphatase